MTATMIKGNGRQAQTVEREIDIEEVIKATENDLRECRNSISLAEPGMQKAIHTSRALARVRQLVTTKFISDHVMPLMNSPLGFMTDKNKAGQPTYTADELREPVCECLIRGFSIAGNEFNVISGRFYGAQAGYRRLVRELPGLTDLEELAGEPVFSQGGGSATVRYIVRCKISGKEWTLKNEEGKPGRKFTIRVNGGMGPDAVIGKAARKALKAAYEEITGTTITDMDDPAPASSGDDLAEPAKPSPLAPGRHSIRKPAPVAPVQEPVDDPQDASIDDSQAAPPEDDGADMLAEEIANAIEETTTVAGHQTVGADLKKAKDYLGDERYAKLLERFQAKGATLKK